MRDIMANRNWANGGKVFAMAASPVMVQTDILIGASGAVTSNSNTTVVRSVTKTGTGLYRLNLSEPFFALFQAMGSVQSPVSGLSGISSIEIQNAPNASVSSSSAPVLIIKTLSAAGALADPASGSKISILAIMNNSSVQS